MFSLEPTPGKSVFLHSRKRQPNVREALEVSEQFFMGEKQSRTLCLDVTLNGVDH